MLRDVSALNYRVSQELLTDSYQTQNPHAEHRHKVDTSKAKGHNHDLGMMAILMHIAGDAINNIGVIAAAAVIWKAPHEGRFYADPGVSMAIAIMITLSGLPVGKPHFFTLLLKLELRTED